ncbi:thermonuclease family protein [Nocardioides sp. Bht2]|uniref:thermonuclease family protein n=1 Tax=Nocardioides sp. Bht2 TaxID=3392297 RepID=UPI0039B37BD3
MLKLWSRLIPVLLAALLMGGFLTEPGRDQVRRLAESAGIEMVDRIADAQEETKRSRGTVVRVVDGDTLHVKVDGKTEKVRLLGVDAPEVRHGAKAGDCYGDRATAELRRLAPGGTRVRLASDPTQGDTDVYGRQLRYLEVDQVDVGRELLKADAAKLYPNRTPIEREQAYRSQEKAAQRADRGLWGQC